MLDDLDDRTLDELPFGVICLSSRMKVLRMNRTEAERSGIQRWRAIGRDYFSDVAPGATNRTLADHIRAFTAGRGERTFDHTFVRRGGLDETRIELERGRDPQRLYLRISR
jgi:photoactive yellow protein